MPSSVHQALASTGQPLEASSRSLLENRFGHDFGHVRVHSDTNAAESAADVHALAYTSGSHIVFGPGQYAPGTERGRDLLTHELVHVIQQSGGSASRPETIMATGDSAEREADQIAGRVSKKQGASTVAKQVSPKLMRKLRVDRPSAPIPNPTGQGRVQTNGETIQGYLRQLSPAGSASVNSSSGLVSLSTAFCPGVAGGLVQGARSGYGVGHVIGSFGGIFSKVPILGAIGEGIGAVVGAVGGIIGGLFGAIGGLFGAVSPARSSSTPTGSTCLCDFVDAGVTWTIEINDQGTPATLDNERVRVPSPNSPQVFGAPTTGGRLENADPYLLLGHELCGHAWLELHNKEEDDMAQKADMPTRDQDTGKVKPMGSAPAGDQYLRHSRAIIERENLIRAEHGLDPRGFRLRDPFCGESFSRPATEPGGAPQFQQGGGGTGFTYLEACQYLRDQLPESRTRRYRVEERIP